MKIKNAFNITILLVINFGFAQLPMSEFQNALKLNSYVDDKIFEDHVNALEKKFPNCAKISFLKGTYQYRIGRLEDAMLFYNKSIARDSTFSYSYIAKATIYAQNNKYDDCVFNLTKAIKYDANNFNAYRLRANFYLSANKKNLALKDIEQCIRVSPKDFNLYLEAINLAITLKEFVKVDEYFAKAYRTLNTNTLNIDLHYGQFLMSQQRYDDAVTTYKKGLTEYNNIYKPEDFNNIAVAYFKTRDYKNAELYSKKSLLLEPTNLDYLFNLISIYGESKEFKKMKLIANQIKKIDKKNTKIDEVLAYYENKQIPNIVSD